MSIYYPFLTGMAFTGAATCGLFFLRSWTRAKDRIFLSFGVAFMLMALERLVLVLYLNPEAENQAHIYLIRLLSFLIILYAIIDKNRKDSRGRQ